MDCLHPLKKVPVKRKWLDTNFGETFGQTTGIWEQKLENSIIIREWMKFRKKELLVCEVGEGWL